MATGLVIYLITIVPILAHLSLWLCLYRIETVQHVSGV
jgi:hypothetical protein